MKTADYIAIQNLLHRYCDCLDRGDMKGVGDLFSNAIVHLPAVDKPFDKDAAGLTKSYKNYVRIYPDGTPRTRHISSNLIIESDGPDRAKAQSYVMVFQAADNFPLQPLIAARYMDTFERVDGIWRFAERIMETDLHGALSSHMLLDFSPQAKA